MFQKVIPVGEAGQVSITEQGGVATVKVELAQKVGGGSVAGVVSAKVSAELDISAIQLIDAGLALLKAKFPAAASIVDGAQAIIDAEVGKL
jgi:hypothetical protein